MKQALRLTLRLTAWLAVFTAAAMVLMLVLLLAAPRIAGWNGAIVLSGSMEPTLKVGGIAFIEPTSDAHSIRVGDVITFDSLKDPRKKISHRVIDITRREDGLYFETKGDNSELPDQQLIPAANLVGKVRFHVPYLGYATEKLRNRMVFYFIVGFPTLLLIFGELQSIYRELSKSSSARARGGSRPDLVPVGSPITFTARDLESLYSSDRLSEAPRDLNDSSPGSLAFKIRPRPFITLWTLFFARPLVMLSARKKLKQPPESRR